MSTVSVYTQVCIKTLKDLHQAMHPAASVSSVKGGRAATDLSAEDLLEALDEEGWVEAE